GKYCRDVSQVPPVTAQVKAGVHILGMLDQRRAAIGIERAAPVYGVCPDTDRAAGPLLTRGLYGAIEELLHGARAALEPMLARDHAEVLRGLDYPGVRVLEIWHQLVEEVS